MNYNIINGDAYSVLQTMKSEQFDCCVTSPPYYNLRDYGTDGQIGLEKTIDEYINNLVNVFREVHLVECRLFMEARRKADVRINANVAVCADVRGADKRGIFVGRVLADDVPVARL